MKKLLLGAGATAALLHSGFALSQVAAAAADAASGTSSSTENLQSVIVTGTRTQGLKAVDSAAPVQVVDSNSLKRAGSPDLIQALAQSVPSLNAQSVGGDTAALTLSARLRGLSPNDTLVLVNGKRRHGTANLAVLSGAYQGGAAADLNYIPISSIDHIEVLQDGAAAQYGTDAIAGVVNIILKTNDSGGSVSASGGGYLLEGGGHTGSVSGNIGFAPIENGYVNISAESRYHGFSQYGIPDPRFYTNPTGNNAGDGNSIYANKYPYQNRIQSDAAYHLNIFSANAGYDLGNGSEIYSNLTYGHKDAEAFENYRGPHVAPYYYPNGFSPEEALTEDDYGLSVGIKGTVFSGWRYDISSTWGRDDAKLRTLNSVNTGYYDLTGASPTNFQDGLLRASQWTNNLDIGKDFEVGLSKPLTVALGVEQRSDKYKIVAGEPASSQQGGAESYPGFASSDAGSHGRNSYAAYLDVALVPISGLSLDIAAREEHFNDFGSTHVGKFTGRYDFTPSFAVRGTASNGFRAPTLAESYYSSVNVGPSYTAGQFAPNSAGARALGINGLKPEKSINYSAGIVLKPAQAVTVTLDAYQILIRDRIVGSGVVDGSLDGVLLDQRVLDALTASGIRIDPTALQAGGEAGISAFVNSVKTRNRGAELVATMPSDYGQYGKVDWTLSGNYNQVKVLAVSNVGSVFTAAQIVDPVAMSYLETASPKFRVNVAGLWRMAGWSVNLMESIYGRSSAQLKDNSGVYYTTEIKTKLITDLDVSRKVTENLTLSLGANNLFNIRPNEVNPAYTATFEARKTRNTQKYPDFSPFGVNGGYYYARANYAF